MNDGACSLAQGQMANCSTLHGYVPAQKHWRCASENGSTLVANNAVDVQQIVDRFSSAADMFGLKINISKTELLYQPPPMSIELPETITVHDEPLKTTESFTHLSSTVTNTNSAELEVERRIQSATKAYHVALQKRLWSYNDNSTKTKVKVYSVAVIPCLLYSIECTALYRGHIMALTRLHLRHLRPILNIKWQDRIPDVNTETGGRFAFT